MRGIRNFLDGWRAAGGSHLKGRRIAALGQTNDNRFQATLLFVILLKLFAQTARLDPYDGLDLGVIAWGPAEDLDSDNGLFEPIGFPFERALHDKAEKLPHAL